MSNTNPARGMRDFLPDAVRKREFVIGIIKEVYEKYGFEPLETPTIENLSTLTNKYGEEGDQLMFKILKRGEKLKKILESNEDVSENDFSDLALRYDLTVPLARVVANYKNDLPKFFKRYQIQPVWRADRPARGRYREFYQCDVDAIGSKSMLVEAELISAICEILEKLGFEDFQIKLNHRTVLISMLEAAGIPLEKYDDALIALDKFDKVGIEGVSKEFFERGVLTSEGKLAIGYTLIAVIENILQVVSTSDAEARGYFSEEEIDRINDKNFEIISNFIEQIELGQKGLKELKQIFEYTKNSFAKAKIEFDPNLARGLSYYTGAIFEIILLNGDFRGSIAGGGRYDGLIGMFGKEEIPAVGFSLGLERILLIMEERGMFPDDLVSNAADVLVTVWNEETAGESLKLANELRQQDLRVTVYPEADKLGKQFKYADQINVPFVCVLGENELAENKVMLKNLKTGEQELVGREEVAKKLKI